LFGNGEQEEALALLRWGRGRHPSDFWLHFELGNQLLETPIAVEREEAIGCYRAALALRPETISAHYNLGNALRAKGQLDEAIAEYREAIRLKKDYEEAHGNLGLALEEMGELDNAVAEYGEAIRLKKDRHNSHYNLGNALLRQGRWDRAIAEYGEAIHLMKEDFDNLYLAYAHYGLGNALRAKGQLDDAIVYYRKAIRLKKDYVEALNTLGVTLKDKGQVDEAIAEYRKAIGFKKDYADAHNNLGGALQAKGELDEAVAEYRKAIEYKKDDAEPHYNLGWALVQKGQFREALEESRRGHELGSRTPGWRYPSARRVRHCERLIELDGKLPAILQGDIKPASPAERIELAGLCALKRLHRAAVLFYKEAFDAQAKLADDLGTANRYNAACAAALAGCGNGEDADKLDDTERARLRRRALDWLRADLQAWGRLVDEEPDKARPMIVKQMRHWLDDADFAGVRGAKALARLPEAEREPWQTLWSDVAVMLARAQANKPQRKSDPK
jgi:tetratricopeptide (TPR) repeat protein